VGEVILAGDLEEAVEMYVQAGSKDRAATARLRAAKALVRKNRLADADAQIQQALAFFRSVGATRYIREAEQLRAAISSELVEDAKPHT
jgi:hypothetical protein